MKRLAGLLLLISSLLMGAGTAAAPVPEADRVPIDLRRTTLVVRDIDNSLALYRDVLGMKVIYDNRIRTPRDAETDAEADRASRLVFLRANDNFIGVLGLLPFFAAALGTMLLSDILQALSQRTFLVYSLAILCFLAGTLWGERIADGGTADRATVVISNGVVVFAVLATLTAGPLVAACLLLLGHIAQFWYERNLPHRDIAYTRMRGWLTAGAVVAHLMYALGLLWRG